jgi:ribosomal protein L40E
MATTLSFGKCAACGENNNMQAQTCRKCNADLPWSKAAKARTSGNVKAVAAATSGGKAPKMQVVGPKTPVVSSEAVTLWAIGLLVFFFCVFISPVGAFIVHRVLSGMESELAGFAQAGLYVCVAIWALGFVGIMASVGDKTSP